MNKLALAMLLCAFPACSTVRYPRPMPLSANERAKFTCEELDSEIADAITFKESIGMKASNSGAEAVAILVDFGIGNAQERAGAIEAADARIKSCRVAKLEKKCPLNAEEQAKLDELNRLGLMPVWNYSRWHNRRDANGYYHTSHDCADAERIRFEDRVEGTGPKFLCPKCRQLAREPIH